METLASVPGGRRSLVFVVSAFNEENRLPTTIEKILSLSDPLQQKAYLIVVADDGSTDKTLEIAKTYSEKYSDMVGFVHHPENIGVGAAFLSTLPFIECDFVSCVPGDDMLEVSCFEMLLEAAQANRPIISVLDNYEERSRKRQLLSTIYSAIWTKSLRLNVKYINGTCTYRHEDLLNTPTHSSSFCLFAELTSKTIIKGAAYTSIAFRIIQGDNSISKNQLLSLREFPGAYFSTLSLLIKQLFLGRAIKQ